MARTWKLDATNQCLLPFEIIPMLGIIYNFNNLSNMIIFLNRVQIKFINKSKRKKIKNVFILT